MNSRRDFLKAALTFAAVPALISLGKNAFAEEKKKKLGGAAAGGFEDAIPGKGSAAALGYQIDKRKVPKANQVEKGGVPFAKQECKNCILYKDGICLAMSDNNRKVKTTSWCTSWTLNPAVKS